MRWAIFVLFALIGVATDASLGGILKIGEAQPRFLPCVVVFAILSAPRQHAVRLALLAGLIADLLSPVLRSDGTQLVVIGPWTLGFALGALAVVPLRTLLYHRNPISSGFATMVFSLLAAIVFVATWVVRTRLLRDDTPPWWPGTGAGEVWRQCKVALANGLVAIPTVWLLERTRPLWGFSTAKRVIPGAARDLA
ncbi:MAG: rod shape-determining protein MreD [Planctomycetota bacterium]|jgi:cell shape-determining protein MreD